jgi:hypothetical protein
MIDHLPILHSHYVSHTPSWNAQNETDHEIIMEFPNLNSILPISFTQNFI